MFRITRAFPHPGPSGLTPPALLRWLPALLLLAALVTATLAACDGNDEEKGAGAAATATATTAPPAGSGTPAPQTNTPSPTANETVSGGVEAAARKLLADELGVGEGDLRLVSSERMTWSDASLGCPQEGMAYAQVITPGYKLVLNLAGTSYAVHTNIDGTHAVVCRDDSGVSASTGDTPTPEAGTQVGAELTIQEYAEALECDVQRVNILVATYGEISEVTNPYIAELEGFSRPPEVARWHELYVQSLRTFLDGLSHLEADDTIDGDSLANLYVLLADTMEEIVAEEEAWSDEVHLIMHDAGCAETEPAEPIDQRDPSREPTPEALAPPKPPGG